METRLFLTVLAAVIIVTIRNIYIAYLEEKTHAKTSGTVYNEIIRLLEKRKQRKQAEEETKTRAQDRVLHISEQKGDPDDIHKAEEGDPLILNTGQGGCGEGS